MVGDARRDLCGGAGADPLVFVSSHDLVGQPAFRKRGDHPERRTDRFPEKSCPPNLGVFETFVVSEDNWLPPDNYQEHPGSVIAHRTSPTNIGLALLSNLSAYDFGYITAGELIARTANTFDTMEKLDRHRGHFYNWYDTQSLRTLPPHYISTVDERQSGWLSS